MPTISSSVAANTAASILARNNEEQAKSIARISSGQRIIQPSDDAAGLAVGTGLLADVAVFKQASTNITGTNAILNVADAGVSAVGDILERQQVLATQAQSAGLDADARNALNTEYQALSAEIDAIQGSTNFNGQNLTDGSFNTDVAVGAGGEVIAADLSNVDVSTANLGTAGTDLLNPANAAAAFAAVDSAIGDVSGFRAEIGATQSRFNFRDNVVKQQEVNTQAAASAILDVDVAAESTRLTNSRVLSESAIAGLSQANALTQSLLNIVR